MAYQKNWISLSAHNINWATFGWPFVFNKVANCNKVFLYVTLSITTKQIVTECKTHRFIIEYMLYLCLSIVLGEHNKHSYSIGFICYHSVLADCFNKSTMLTKHHKIWGDEISARLVAVIFM